MHKARYYETNLEQTKVGHVAKINGIAVAQASEAFFNTYYSITMLLPFDGAEHKFATLEDAQKFIVADVLHTVNLLLHGETKHGVYGTYPDSNNIVDD